MPTKHVSADVMDVGRKGGGKHWTKKEIEARQAADEMVTRKTRVNMRAPIWLGDEAKEVWKKVRKKAAGMDLLDNLDAEVLAMYCDAVVQYQDAQKNFRDKPPLEAIDRNQAIRNIQSWSRLVLTYAEKLGFTPTGRARLVKKRADELVNDKFGDEFD